MQKLNTTAVYLLSIAGFICCCVGLGWIPALIGFLMANSALKKYNLDPSQYENGKAMKTARTVALIALIISLLFVVGIIIFILSFDSECQFWDWYMEQVLNNPSVTDEQLAPIYQRMEQLGCM